MPAVDSLNIKVDASARSANQQLDKLVQKMKELRRTVGSLNTHELDTFAKSMHSFTNAAKAMTGMRSSDFTRLAKNLDKITDARKMEKTAQSAEKAAESLEKTAAMAKRALGSSFKTDGTGIQDLQKSIRSLSNEFANAGKGKSFDGTLQELEKEAEKLREKLDKLGEKEQKILAVGGTSAESKTFKGLQYDISATLNQLSALEEKIAQVKSADKQDLSSIPIIRYDAGSANTTTGGLSQFKKNVERVFEGIPESARYSVEDAKKTLHEALSSVHESDSAPSYSFRNYTEEIKALKAELKDLESAGRGMGSDEWDEAYMKLRRVTEEAKEYKAHLDNPTAGLDEDIRKTDSLGNRLESLKTKLKELKASGLNFGDKEFDKTYNNLKNVETELSSYKSKLAGTKTSLKECKTNLVAVRSEATPLGKRFASAFNEITKNIRNSNRAVLSFFRNMKSNLFISNKMSNGFDGLTAKFAKLFVGVRALKTAFSSLKSSIDLASDLTEVQNVVDVAFGKYSKGIEKLSKTSIQNFGMSELTAKQIAGRFQAIGTAVGFSQKKMSGMSVELTKLAADMASFYNVEQEDVAKSLQSVFTGTTQPLRKYGIDLTQATLEEWAHKQGVDADMKSMSQAEKTMLRYKYIISQTNAAQGDFARTSDTWANQTRILKQNFQQLGAIIGTDFINALKPVVKAINSIMGQVIDFATIISNALGKIFGWKYESGGGVVQDYSDDLENAADNAGKTAEATDKAAEAQKKFNKQLQGFDKLNNLTTSSANSNKSDGKGTNGSTDLSGLDGAGGKWTAQDSVLKSFKSDIDSLEKLGGTIADALSKAMESIPWNEIYNKAKDFGSGLASFLNGMFTGSKGKKLFENTGKTIAAAINTSMYAVDEFAKNFKWKSFGENLSTGLNSFFETWDADLTSETFNDLANGILESCISAIGNTSWTEIGQKIANLIGEIDAKGISWKLGKLVNSMTNAFYQLVANKSTWENLGKKIADGINGFFKGMNDVDQKTNKTGWEALAESISETIKGALTSISEAMEDTDWEQIGENIVDFFANVDWAGIIGASAKLIASVASGIFKLLKGALKNDIKYLKKYLPEWIKNIGKFYISLGAKIGTAATSFAKEVTDFIKNIPKNFINIAIKIGTTVANFAKSMSKFISNLPQKIISLGMKIGETISNFASKLSDFVKKLPAETIELFLKIGTTISEWKEKIESFVSEIPDFVISAAFEIGTKVSDAKDMISNFVKKLPKNAVKLGVTLASGAKDAKKAVAEFVSNLPAKGIELAIKLVSSAKDVKKQLSDFVAKIPKKAISLGITLASTAEDAKNAVEKFIKNIPGKAISLVANLATNPEDIEKALITIKDKAAKKVVKLGVSLMTNVKEIWSEFKNKAASLFEKVVKLGASMYTKPSEIWKDFKEKASALWNNVVKLSVTLGMDKSPAETIKNIKEKWTNKLKKYSVALKIVGALETGAIKSAIKLIIGWINSYVIGALNKISVKIPSWVPKMGGKRFGFDIPTIKIPKFENGGFPRKADLFFANEDGKPELVGRYGSKTQVINNEQIMQGVSQGVADAVYNVMTPVLSKMVIAINGMNQKGTPLYVEGVSDGDIVRITTDANSRYKKTHGKPLYS